MLDNNATLVVLVAFLGLLVVVLLLVFAKSGRLRRLGWKGPFGFGLDMEAHERQPGKDAPPPGAAPAPAPASGGITANVSDSPGAVQQIGDRNVAATGSGSVAIGGNVSGSTIVTGDGNRVGGGGQTGGTSGSSGG